MALTLPTLCAACVHYRIKELDSDKPTCDAYPDGIPWEFWGGGVAHYDPDGEGGIAFELRDGYEGILEAFAGYWGEVAVTDDDS